MDSHDGQNTAELELDQSNACGVVVSLYTQLTGRRRSTTDPHYCTTTRQPTMANDLSLPMHPPPVDRPRS